MARPYIIRSYYLSFISSLLLHFATQRLPWQVIPKSCYCLSYSFTSITVYPLVLPSSYSYHYVILHSSSHVSQDSFYSIMPTSVSRGSRYLGSVNPTRRTSTLLVAIFGSSVPYYPFWVLLVTVKHQIIHCSPSLGWFFFSLQTWWFWIDCLVSSSLCSIAKFG